MRRACARCCTAPWQLWPAVAVIVAVLALNFLGDGLRDASDPYSR